MPSIDDDNNNDGNDKYANELYDETIVEGALFDETAAAYARLRGKAEQVMADMIAQAVRDALRGYAKG